MKQIILVIAAGLVMMGTSVDQKEIHFQTQKISIGSEKVEAEIADTSDRHERGLMFRNAMKENHGMLFIFKTAETRHFWMKNTFINLSIAFMDEKKKIIDIQEMQASSSEMETDPKIYESKGPAKYALEMNPGWFGRHHVSIGDSLKLESE